MKRLCLTHKEAKAILTIAEKDSTRYYVNGAHLTPDNKQLVVSDSLVLLSIPAFVAEEEGESTVNTIVSAKAIETQAKVARALKEPSATIDVTDSNTIPGQYPPYETAMPTDPTYSASYNINNLIKILEALKLASGEKEPIVEIYTSSGKSTLLKVTGKSEIKGLCVTVKQSTTLAP